MKLVISAIGILIISGCASFTPEGKTVKMVDTSELEIVKKECKHLGGAAGMGSPGDAKINLFNEAGKLGANVIVSKNQPDYAGKDLIGLSIYIAKGVAFKCPEATKAKLINAEAL